MEEVEVGVVMTMGLQVGPRGWRWRCAIEREDAAHPLPHRCLRVIGYGTSPALVLANALVGATEGTW